MIEKINNFCDKILRWKVIKYLLLGDLFMVPYSFFITMFNIPTLFNVIMIFSLCFSINSFSKAIKNIVE